MSVQIDIRNIPREIEDELAVQAARTSESMQEGFKDGRGQPAPRPSLDEWLNRIRRRKELTRRTVAANIILDHLAVDRQ
ncbi:MAG: hypothetical protein GY842_00540 [bacterium]|nr:hypothetical protein [bacterium]